MIITYVNAVVSAQDAAKFEEMLTRIVRAALRLPGCEKSEWYRNPEKLNHYTMYGEFDSEESFNLYKKSDIVKMISTELIPLVISKPKYRHFRAQVFEEG